MPWRVIVLFGESVLGSIKMRYVFGRDGVVHSIEWF